MPRGRKKTVLEVEIPQENEGEHEAERETEDESDALIAEDKSENPRHPFKMLYRLDPDGGDPAYIGKFAIEALNQDTIAKRFGGGTYRIITRRPRKEKGGYEYAGMQTIKIDAAVHPTQPLVRTGDPVVQGERAGSTLTETLMLSMMKQQAESAQQNMQMMQGLFTALAGAFTALKPTGPTTDPVLLAVVQGMMQRKDPTEIAAELMRSMKDSGTVPKDPITMLKEVLELRDLLGSGEGGGDNELSLIGKGLDTIKTMFQNGQMFQPPATVAVRPMPASPAPALPAAPAAPAAPAVVPTSTVEAVPPMPVSINPAWPAWKQGVAQNLDFLIQAASFLQPDAAALTAKSQMQQAGVWASLVEDVKASYPDVDAMNPPDEFPDAWITKATEGLALSAKGPDVEAWALATFEELAYLAVQGEDEDGSNDAGE